MMDNTIVLEGWLTKSPPEKRLWRSKWRQRWFVLKQSGQIPGQHLLEYYADNAYKKFKGRIDLDECEQVDAGLSLKFESGARSNKHVFDLKTSKRVYYLATKTEEEMNKWVACICSVCGLKMRDDEPDNGNRGNRYSPQPSAEKSPNNLTNNPAHLFASVSATSSTRTAAHVSPSSGVVVGGGGSSSRINNNNSVDAAVALNYSVPRSANDRLSNGNNKHQKEPSNPSEGPYIPISECHTGKPGSGAAGTTAKENRPSNQTQAHPLCNSSSKSNLAVPIARASKSNSHVILADEFYDVPRSSQLVNGSKTGPPPPNWDTFPKDDKNRASSRSCSASFDAKATSGRTAAISAASHASSHRTRCESGPGDGETGTGRINVPIRRAATPTAEYMNSADVPDFAAGLLVGSKEPPPRPPKPATLSRSKIEREPSPPSLTVECYDIPKSSVEKTSPGKAVPDVKRRPSAANDPLPDILDRTVEKPALSAVERKTIDSYDIPKSVKVQVSDADILDATVALHPSTRSESGRHSYDNSAPGFIATKDCIFNYDSRPSLPITSDDHIVNLHSLSSDPGANEAGVLAPDRSPRTPNSAFSEVTPPAVDRNLKPRRKGSDSDATASPTTPNPFLLKPAPDGRRQSGGGFAASGAASVRGSPAASASTLPSVRNKSFTTNNGHSQQLAPVDGTQGRLPGRVAPQIIHSRDASTSEDDSQKTRSTDELKKKSRPTRKPRPVPEGPELQYLDLDLDSDNSSPRTPNLVHIDHQTSVSSLKEFQGHCVPSVNIVTSTSTLPSGSPSASKSTVYKTVDFVKTDALNTLRHKVEEGHRNPQ